MTENISWKSYIFISLEINVYSVDVEFSFFWSLKPIEMHIFFVLFYLIALTTV